MKKLSKGASRTTFTSASAGENLLSMMPSFLKITNEGHFLLSLLIKPCASTSQLLLSKTTILTPYLECQVAAPPRECEANVELISFLCKHLGVRKSELRLTAGLKSRNKIIEVSKNAISLEVLLQRLILY